MASPYLQGFESGVSASLRIQQLRSQRAAQAARERAIAQEMALVMENRNNEIQFRADMAKAVGSARMEASEEIVVPGADGAGTFTMPNPNRLTDVQAAMKHVLPVVAKHRPEKVPDVLEGIYRAEYQRNQGQDFTPTAGSVQTPDGRSIPYVKTSPRSAQLVGQSDVQTITDPTTGRNVTGVRTATGAFKPLPEDIGARKTIDFVRTKASHLLKMREDGSLHLPPENWNEATRIAGQNQTFRTKMLEQMQAAGDAFQTGQKLVTLLTPENVGVRGAVSRLKDATLGQINPNLKGGSSSEMLATSKAFMAGLVKALRSDGNIGIQEREELIAGMPTPDKLLSSVVDSKVKLATQLELAAIKSRDAANTLGNPISPFFLKPEEIRQMIISGQFTEDEGIAIWNNNAWNLINTIRSQVQE